MVNLSVIGVRQRLDIYTPVGLVGADVVAESTFEGLIVAFGLAVRLCVIRGNGETTYAEDRAEEFEEFADKLRAIVREQRCWYAIRVDPIVEGHRCDVR